MLTVACADASQADLIATMLVERRLAACVQSLPVRSVYRWQGAVERADEVLLLVKTSGAQAEAATEAVRAAHSYAVPEVLALTAEGGLPAYLDWINAETG